MQWHTDLGLLQFCRISVILMVAVPLGTSVIAPDRNDNPVEFIGFEDGDLDVTDAEVDIGRTLTDASIETVFVVSTLQFNNSIYVPWSCTQPGSRQVSVYDGNNLTIPLSYVYGKPGKLTPDYLSFPAPLRYLSLTTLSQKVAWLKKGLALRLRVRNDSISEEMWSNSTGDLRRSFIHRIVNETLTRSFQRVTRTEDYLDGAIYVRGDETIEYKGVSVQPGNVPKYSKCDRSHLALNKTSDGVSYPYTVCSSWRPLENDSTSIKIFWTFYGLILALVILCGFFAGLASQYVGRLWLYVERHNAGAFPNELDPIPTSLTIMSILRARNFLLLKVKNSVDILQIVFILVLDIALYLATIFAPFKFFDLNYLLEDISVFSTCWQSSNVHYMLVCFWLGVSLHILVTLDVFMEVCSSNKMKHVSNWRKWMRSFNIYLISPHFYYMVINFFGVILYTVVGLSLNYLAICIGILALTKVVVFDILKFTRVNISVSPVVASCSAAAWQALEELQDAISAKVLETTSFGTETTDLTSSRDNRLNSFPRQQTQHLPETTDSTPSRDNRLNTFPRQQTQHLPETTDSTPSREKDAEKYSEELRQQFEDVVCQLCKKYIFNNSPTGSTEEFEGSTDELERFIIASFSRYMFRRIAIIGLLFVALLYFQNLIVNFEQLSNVKGIFSFFVPTATVLIGLVGPIRGEKPIKFTTGQKTDAKLYFLHRMKILQALASEQTVAVEPDGSTAQPSSVTDSEASV